MYPALIHCREFSRVNPSWWFILRQCPGQVLKVWPSSTSNPDKKQTFQFAYFFTMLEYGGLGGLAACPVNPPAGGRYPMPGAMPPRPPAPCVLRIWFANGVQPPRPPAPQLPPRPRPLPPPRLQFPPLYPVPALKPLFACPVKVGMFNCWMGGTWYFAAAWVCVGGGGVKCHCCHLVHDGGLVSRELIDRIGYFRQDCGPVGVTQRAPHGHFRGLCDRRSWHRHGSFGTAVGIVSIPQNVVHVLIVVWSVSL